MPAEQRPTVPVRSAAPDGATPATLQLVGGTATGPVSTATGPVSTATGPGGTAHNGTAAEPLRILQVQPWDDPNLHRDGHDPRSAYVERFWIAVLGPSAVWLLRLLAREFDELAPGEILRLDLESTAQRLGLQHRGGRQSTFMRTIDRCRMFDLAHFENDAVLIVRRQMPPVPRRLHVRMPRELREEIGRWTRTVGHTDFSVGETRLLATCMLMLGHGLHESAERLVMLGLAPKAANEATAWAWAERCVRPHATRGV